MAQQLGDAAPPVQRSVEATTMCFSEAMDPAGHITVLVACSAARSLEFWSGGRERDVIKKMHADGGNTTTFAVADLATLQSDAACRATLRGMVASLPQLRSLRLAEDEWDAVVPWHLVPWIIEAASRGSGYAFTFFFRMTAHRRVIVDERGLLTACKEWLPATAPEENSECPICLDGLDRAPAVELPGCDHAFHGHCISTWFSTCTACPVCRGDVFLAALPKLLD
ncbi:unnamed protein product [Alopecurus aequalis]